MEIKIDVHKESRGQRKDRLNNGYRHTRERTIPDPTKYNRRRGKTQLRRAEGTA